MKKDTTKKNITPAPAPQQGQKVIKLLLLKNWLLSGKTITSRQSSKMWGYDRAADGIWKLRNPPHNLNIATIPTSGQDRYLNDVEYATYKWLGEVPVITFLHVTITPDRAKMYYFSHRYPMKMPQIRKHIMQYLSKKKVSIKKILTRKTKGVRTYHVTTATDLRIFVIHQTDK